MSCCGNNSDLAFLDVFLIYLRGLAQPGQWKNTLTPNSREYEMTSDVSVRPYPCQCYNRVRRGGPAGDDEAGFMPVDAQHVRCWTRLHKRLLRICGMKKKQKTKWVIFKTQLSQKLRFKADEAPHILSFRWTMICTNLQLLHWRSCYATTEISSAIESEQREGIQSNLGSLHSFFFFLRIFWVFFALRLLYLIRQLKL